MDRLVKVEAAELELNFRPLERCSAAIKVTSLIHTMPVAVKLTTTRPTVYSFSPDFVALLQPLSSAVFTLVLLPTASPPFAAPPDFVLVSTLLAPALRRANSASLCRFFSRPALPIFRDGSLPVHLIGPHALRSLLLGSGFLQDILLPRIIKSCSLPELSAALPFAGGNAISALLDAGADPNAVDEGGKSVISLAVSAGSADAVETLLEAGASDRPFHEAAGENRTDLMAVLLAWSGSEPWFDRADAYGRTPVHCAAERGALDALRLSLTSGGDPHQTDSSGWTPLHYSAAGGHFNAAELIMNSSDFDLRRTLTREGKGRRKRTPFDLAVEKGHAHLYDLLRPGGEVIRAARCGSPGDTAAAVGKAAERDQNGWTALHVAALKGRAEIVRELINGGAELEAVDDSGYTPLRCAVEAGHTEVALLLVRYGARAGLKGLVKSKYAAATATASSIVSGHKPVWESCAAAVSSAILKYENHFSFKKQSFGSDNFVHELKGRIFDLNIEN
ncbi:hypothetical protein KFK09_002036 [Dendrobium nobile]|uniref:Uncharacterized protein n=1 Tax=Dendrobium nobile TaxID=94219 RepID=A0A8T3C6H3_DENNO|nr:hypothetical protein KFK09_002036 [Dendrobium nobile]